MIPIFPICDSSKIYYNWNYTILCIFLNEFHDFKVKDHGFEDKETKLCFHFENYLIAKMARPIMLITEIQIVKIII